MGYHAEDFFEEHVKTASSIDDIKRASGSHGYIKFIYSLLAEISPNILEAISEIVSLDGSELFAVKTLGDSTDTIGQPPSGWKIEWARPSE